MFVCEHLGLIIIRVATDLKDRVVLSLRMRLGIHESAHPPIPRRPMTECWLGRLNAVTNPHVEKVRPSIIEINLNDFEF